VLCFTKGSKALTWLVVIIMNDDDDYSNYNRLRIYVVFFMESVKKKRLFTCQKPIVTSKQGSETAELHPKNSSEAKPEYWFALILWICSGENIGEDAKFVSQAIF
jgi:hypothetical protein